MKHARYFNESVQVRKSMRRSLNENRNEDYKIEDYVYGSYNTDYYLVPSINLQDDDKEEIKEYLKQFDKDVCDVYDDSGNFFGFGLKFTFTKPYDPKEYEKRLNIIANKLVEYCDKNGIEFK